MEILKPSIHRKGRFAEKNKSNRKVISPKNRFIEKIDSSKNLPTEKVDSQKKSQSTEKSIHRKSSDENFNLISILKLPIHRINWSPKRSIHRKNSIHRKVNPPKNRFIEKVENFPEHVDQPIQ